MRRGSKIAAAPTPLPRHLLSRSSGVDWRRWLAWLCALVGVALCVVYLERTKTPLPVRSARASAAKDSEPSWGEMLRELQAMHAADVEKLRRGAEDGSALETWLGLPQERQDELLERGVGRLRQEPLIRRLSPSSDEQHELMLKIAPELVGVPGTASFDVPKLLQALLAGTENDGVLPPVAEPADQSAAAVATQQVALLRHKIRRVPRAYAQLLSTAAYAGAAVVRSTMLSKFAAFVLFPTHEL